MSCSLTFAVDLRTGPLSGSFGFGGEYFSALRHWTRSVACLKALVHLVPITDRMWGRRWRSLVCFCRVNE